MWYYIHRVNAHQTRCARSLKNGHNGGNAYEKMIAFVMALALVCTNVPANLHVQTGTETVYAAQETAINSEQALIVRSKIMRESGCLIMQKMQPLKTLS